MRNCLLVKVSLFFLSVTTKKQFEVNRKRRSGYVFPNYPIPDFCHLLESCFKQLDLFSFRTKLRHMLEWSCLYRVTLLLSKINDDSDLDAEAAILYGKVGTYVEAKC